MSNKKILSALEIAKIACDIESDGVAFYNDAAAATSDVEINLLFKTLSEKEFEHLNKFRTLYAELDERMGGTDSTAEYLFDDQITQYLKVISAGLIFPEDIDIKAWLQEPHAVKDALNMALNIEKHSILFYTEIASFNLFAQSQVILKSIIEEEKTHVIMISQVMSGMK
jgi:rubrerythrin